ncbi:MAG: ATPase [Spirochaetia bacterium]|nr:ATPase [Spirochaetia bacterium]
MSKIAVLSGKGGSGKTFISTNLSNIINGSTYLDCDVEEPNGHIFYSNCKLLEDKKVYRLVPNFDSEKCNGCRDCVNFCKFSALAFIGNKPLLFDEVCHSCGGCNLVCSQNAISDKEIEVGTVSIYSKNDNTIISGQMKIGEASAVSLISEVLKNASEQSIIDCPPGSACSTMEAIKGADYCILVTEPTIFSLHNIMMIVELVELFNIPYGFVINKSDDSIDYIIEDYIKSINQELLIKIPFSTELAKSNASGKLININSKEIDNFNQLKVKLIEKGIIK